VSNRLELANLVAPLHDRDDGWLTALVASWGALWPGLAAALAGAGTGAAQGARLGSLIPSQRHKLLLEVTLASSDAALAAASGAFAAAGLRLSRHPLGGVAQRGDDSFYVVPGDDEGEPMVLEAHLLCPAPPPAERLRLVAGLGLGDELLEVAAAADLREVLVERAGAETRAELKMHLPDVGAAEERLLATGFVLAGLDGDEDVPVLVRGIATVLLAGGTWYAYSPRVPAGVLQPNDDDSDDSDDD
jgi:hypothetical protein